MYENSTQNTVNCQVDYSDPAIVDAKLAERAAEFEASSPAGNTGAAVGGTARQGKRRFHLKTSEEVTSVPHDRYILKGVIPGRGIGQIYGASKSAKTFLSLALCAAVSDGEPFFYGKRVKRTPVVYICLEGENGFRKRIRALEQWRMRKLDDSFKFIIDEHFALNSEEDVLALSEVCPKNSLIVIDTQNASCPFIDENSARDMGTLIQGAKDLAFITDSFVLLIAHTGKDVGRGPRGSSVQVPAFDCCIEVNRAGDYRAWTTNKVKDDKDNETFPFRLTLIDLGADEDGDSITSCVAVPVDKDDLPSDTKLTKSQTYALESLKKACSELQKDTVHVDEWRPIFYAGHTADKESTKRRAFNRAREDLRNLGIVTVKNDLYSLYDVPAEPTVPAEPDPQHEPEAVEDTGTQARQEKSAVFTTETDKRDKRDKAGQERDMSRREEGDKAGQTGHTPLGVSHVPLSRPGQKDTPETDKIDLNNVPLQEDENDR